MRDWKSFIPIFSVLFLIFACVWFAIVSSKDYLDITSFCRIDLNEDIVRGNKKTIKSALSHLKKTDRQSYKITCRHIDEITERYCIDADHHLDRSAVEAGFECDGCYIRGSKTLYLKPETGSDRNIISRRANAIAKNAKLSQDYWNKK